MPQDASGNPLTSQAARAEQGEAKVLRARVTLHETTVAGMPAQQRESGCRKKHNGKC
jgi:hypothetical protein